MTNLWPDSFEANDKPSAKSILEEQARLLPKLTEGMVYAEVSEIDPIDQIGSFVSDDFAYRFDLRGKFLESYRFNVLRFGHDITLYPVKFQLDERIGQELNVQKRLGNVYALVVDSPQALEPFLAAVLGTQRIRDVVGSIIRLSK